MFLEIRLLFSPHMCVWTGGNEDDQKRRLLILDNTRGTGFEPDMKYITMGNL